MQSLSVIWRARRLAPLLALGFASRAAVADPFVGGASAATSSPDGVRRNPANFAFVEQSYFDVSPRIFEVNHLYARYPGFNTIDKETRGISPLGALSFAPSSVDGGRRKLGFVLSEVIPPVSVDYGIKGLPVVVLDQLLFVDLDAKVAVRGGIGGAVAYRASDRFGFGLSANYRRIDVVAQLKAPGNEGTLGVVDTSLTTMQATAGARYQSGRFSLGAAVPLVQQNDVRLKLRGGLFDAAGGAGAPAKKEPVYARSVLLGSSVRLTRSLTALADFEYTRAVPGETRFSIVDFEEQRLDAYDTLATRLGLRYHLTSRKVFSMGYTNEPGAIGPGKRGPGTTTGYGTIDFVPVFAGVDELRPFWAVVAGYGQSFRRWHVAGGVAYQEASLGIDQDGELPAAYEQRRYSIPVQVTYRY